MHSAMAAGSSRPGHVFDFTQADQGHSHGWAGLPSCLWPGLLGPRLAVLGLVAVAGPPARAGPLLCCCRSIYASGWVAASRLICCWTPEGQRGASLGSLAFAARVSSGTGPPPASLQGSRRLLFAGFERVTVRLGCACCAQGMLEGGQPPASTQGRLACCAHIGLLMSSVSCGRS